MNNPFEKLRGAGFSDKGTPAQEVKKESKKPLDVMARNILESAPGLRNKIVSAMGKLSLSSRELPLIHVTTEKIVLPGVSDRNPNFIKQIEDKGFKGRHTNVGAFVVREERVRMAAPNDFSERPEDLLKSLYILLQRYLHHGIRTNKDVYGKERDWGKGVPIMLVLEGNLPVERGSDYDDHYILKQDMPSSAILGKIRFETGTAIDNETVVETASRLLEIVVHESRFGVVEDGEK